MLPDLLYLVPRPAWWPQPGSNVATGYRELLCVKHAWRRLPVVLCPDGRRVSVAHIARAHGRLGHGVMTQRLYGISGRALYEALEFCARYEAHVRLESAIESLQPAELPHVNAAEDYESVVPAADAAVSALKAVADEQGVPDEPVSPLRLYPYGNEQGERS